jgi:hypothetical protein
VRVALRHVAQCSDVPLIVLAPNVLAERDTMRITIGALVCTLDEQCFGEIYRLVLDLQQQAVVVVVLLGRDASARDVLVPIEFIDAMNEDVAFLHIVSDELEVLPTFTNQEFTTPPPRWTSFDRRLNGPVLVTVAQRKRIGPVQQDVPPGARGDAR